MKHGRKKWRSGLFFFLPQIILSKIANIQLFLQNQSIMLRRPATTIKLTPEDILEYDESAHQQQVHQEQERHQFDQFQEHQSDPDSSNLSFKESSHINNQNSVNPPLNRDERIGVTRNQN